jgi:hypothetical protein
MAVAIVLISAEPGKDRKVASQLKKLEGVEKPFLVSGLYDVNNNAGRWILVILVSVRGLNAPILASGWPRWGDRGSNWSSAKTSAMVSGVP